VLRAQVIVIFYNPDADYMRRQSVFYGLMVGAQGCSGF
jgi:hypothetical protein